MPAIRCESLRVRFSSNDSRCPTPLSALAVSPEGRRLMTGNRLINAVVWGIETGSALTESVGDLPTDSAPNGGCNQFHTS